MIMDNDYTPGEIALLVRILPMWNEWAQAECRISGLGRVEDNLLELAKRATRAKNNGGVFRKNDPCCINCGEVITEGDAYAASFEDGLVCAACVDGWTKQERIALDYLIDRR